MGVRRATAMLIAASTVALIPAGAANARAHINGFSAFDQRLLSDMNAAREQHGLAPLQLSQPLESVAYSWAQRMASVERAYDNPRFGRAMNAACPDWRHVGETVGEAGEASADDLFDVYMRDSSGRQTILSRRFHVVGVSTVPTNDDGVTEYWNAIEFSDRCAR